MANAVDQTPAPATRGRVLHWARLYDAVVWVFMLGRERTLRGRTLDLARLRPGESVLDVGCGTGTLALAAKARVGPSGTVCGIDAAAEMVTRATRKAERAGLDVAFRHAVIETLPYPDGQFDVVLSTLMMHHLPRDVRSAAAREIRRVLKPGGRVLVMDFGAGGQNRGGLLAHVHRHGGVGLAEIADLLRDAGLHPVESGPVGTRDLHFTLAQAPGGA